MIKIDSILQVENYLDGIEFVVFDLDDTLYSEKEYVRSGFHKIAEAFCLPKLEYDLWDSFIQGEKAIDAVFEKEKMTNRKNEAISIYRTQIPNIHLYDGVWDMLLRIKGKGKILGMLTDGRPEGQRAKIDALGIDSIFDEILVTDELGGYECRKPNNIGFITLHKRTGISYGKTVYIGDNLNKDFVSPEKLRMRCIYFDNIDGLYKKNSR